jgi:hypothetical protein
MNRSEEVDVALRRTSGHREEPKTGGLDRFGYGRFCFVRHALAAEGDTEGPQQPRYARRDRPTVQPSAQIFYRERFEVTERPDIGLLRQSKLGVFEDLFLILTRVVLEAVSPMPENVDTVFVGFLDYVPCYRMVLWANDLRGEGRAEVVSVIYSMGADPRIKKDLALATRFEVRQTIAVRLILFHPV